MEELLQYEVLGARIDNSNMGNIDFHVIYYIIWAGVVVAIAIAIGIWEVYSTLDLGKWNVCVCTAVRYTPQAMDGSSAGPHDETITIT